MRPWIKNALLFCAVLAPQTWLLFNQHAGTTQQVGDTGDVLHHLRGPNTPVVKGLTLLNGLVQNAITGTIDPANLTTTGVTAASYGGTTAQVSGFTVNSAGQITSASSLYHTAPNATNPLNVYGTGPGAIGGVFDGNPHPLSNYFATTAAAQAAFPGVYIGDLTNQLDRVALQAAVNAAVTQGINKTFVPGSAYLDSPVFVTNNGFELYGDLNYLVLKNVTNQNCLPLVMTIPPSYPNVHTAGSLATGNGSSYNLNGQWWLNLSDITAPVRTFGSGSVWTFEFFINLASIPSNSFNFPIHMGGSLTNSSAAGFTKLNIGWGSGQGIVIQYNINGTSQTKTFSAAALTLNTTHHFATVFNSGTLQVFVDGVSQGTATIPNGAFSVNVWDDLLIGNGVANWPDSGGQIYSPTNGLIDSIRIDAHANYTANFTPPTAKLTSNPFTKYLLNFTQTNGPTVLTDTPPGCWLWQRDITNSQQGISPYIHDLNLNESAGGYGLVNVLMPNARVTNIKAAGSRGIYFWNNTYQGILTNCTASCVNGQFAIGMSNQSVSTVVKDCICDTPGMTGFGVVNVVGGQILDNVTCTFGLTGMLINGVDSVILRGCNYDFENAGSQYCAYFFNCDNPQMQCCTCSGLFETSNACIVADTCGTLTTSGGWIDPPTGGYAFQVTNPQNTSVPIRVDNTLLLGGSWITSANLGMIQFAQIPGTPLVAVSPSAGALAVNFAIGSDFQLLLGNGAQTVTVSNATVGQKGTLWVQQPATGAAGTVSSWFSGFTAKWQGGSAPNLTATNGKIDRIDFEVNSSTVLLLTPTLNY